MSKRLPQFLLLTAMFQCVASAAIHYVNSASTSPAAPYSSWGTAARNIQDAVDAATASDQVLVAAGLYSTGVRYAAGVLNRVVVTNALTIQSVAGPDVTVIEGTQANEITNRVRCVYLGNGAVLIGFTLTNGNGVSATGWAAGGVYGQSTAACLSNCVVTGNADGGACRVTLLSCSLTANQALTGNESGGGAAGCILTNCTVSGNTASWSGGGVAGCTLSCCRLTGNWAWWYSGGADGSTLYDCTLDGNSAGGAGGAGACSLYNCLVINNSAAGYGGGAGGFLGMPVMNCTFSNNSATYGGGASAATLIGCTLSGNSASQNGGGAESSWLSNCLVTGNSAGWGGGVYSCQVTNCVVTGNQATEGGGAYNGILQSCIIRSNYASSEGGGTSVALVLNCALLTNSALYGGGAADGVLDSCVLMGNTADFGGGMSHYYPVQALLNNCTVVGNYATNMGGGAFVTDVQNSIVYLNGSPVDPNLSGCTNVYFSCTFPLPQTGFGNLTNSPAFVDLPAGNLDLLPGSALIDSGSNLYASNRADFLGRPRVSGGTVDIGAYESPSLDPFHNWLQQHGLPSDGSADYSDFDQDGMNNWQEWIAGTDPTNAASVLRITGAATLPGQGVSLTWLSAANRSYFVERSTNLLQSSAFVTLRTNIPGLPGSTGIIDTNPPAPPGAWYRVGVHQ